MNGKCVLPCSGNNISSTCNITCDSKCNLCYSSLNQSCQSCKLPYYYYNFSCLSACPVGTYSSSLFCYPCHPFCQTCKGPKLNDCLSCTNSLFLYKENCVKKCLGNTYQNATSSRC